MNLRKKSETNTSITLEWDAVPSAIGYRFQSAKSAPKWSHTWQAGRTQVTFDKADWYEVEALGIEDKGRYPSATPPPPSGYKKTPYQLHALGDDADHFTDQFHHFSTVSLSAFQYHRVAGIKAADPTTKVLCYRTAPDMRNIGIGASMPTLEQRLGWDSTLLYNEAALHDQQNPNDKWILTSDGVNAMNPWFSYAAIFGGNVAKPSFRAQCLVRLRELLSHQPLWDGFFFDNVSPSSAAFCHEIPDHAAWVSALKGWMTAVAKPLRDEGKIMSYNTAVYIGGDSGSDTGELTLQWWDEMGKTGAVDLVMTEYAYQDPNDTAHNRLNIPGYPNEWMNWHTGPTRAYAAGLRPMMNVMIHGAQGGVVNSKQMRYGVASAMLRWSGDGPVFSFGHHAHSGDPWQFPLTFDLGQPTGAETPENGGFKRSFQNGRVLVNPTPNTITIGGRSVASGDAYIGA